MRSSAQALVPIALIATARSALTTAFSPSTLRRSSPTQCKFLGFVSDQLYDRRPLHRMTSNDEFDSGAEDSMEDEDHPPVIAESVVRIDDGGSDLTDRFKYKVNALMGVFDPPAGAADDENQSGNILNAMLTFPVRYAFNVVGRTSGDDDVKEMYVKAVKEVVTSSSGDDVGLEMRVTPRGKSFTRVSATVTVESAAMINSIYEELGDIERTVMRY